MLTLLNIECNSSCRKYRGLEAALIVVVLSFPGVLTQAHAQEQKPLRCGIAGYSSTASRILKCDVIKDVVTISDVTLNRGNCLTVEAGGAMINPEEIESMTNKTMSLETVQMFIASLEYKKTFKFGDAVYIYFGRCNLLEYSITANGVEWSFQHP